MLGLSLEGPRTDPQQCTPHTYTYSPDRTLYPYTPNSPLHTCLSSAHIDMFVPTHPHSRGRVTTLAGTGGIGFGCEIVGTRDDQVSGGPAYNRALLQTLTVRRLCRTAIYCGEVETSLTQHTPSEANRMHVRVFRLFAHHSRVEGRVAKQAET